MKNSDKISKIVFLDDNQALTMAWEMAAKNLGKEIVTFNTVSDFMNNFDKYDLSSVFYLDVELENGQKGSDVAKILYEKGYRNIYLATGYPKSHFGDVPWVKGIVGKEPHF